jgi:hypothetical protein
MSLYKYLGRIFNLLMLLALPSLSWAGTYSPTVGVTSFQESLSLGNGANSDHVTANYFGNSIGVNYLGRWFHEGDTATEFDLAAGWANTGALAGPAPYSAGNQISWVGEAFSVRHVFEVADTVNIETGPLLLARQISWPNSGSTQVQSGASVLPYWVVDFKFKIRPPVSLTQRIGTSLTTASAYWAVVLEL